MTVYKQQLLLEYLGFSPGPLDGLDGPKTRAAAKKFQAAYGLEVTEKSLTDAVAGLIEPVGVNIDTAPEETDWWKDIRYFKRSEFACKCGGKYCNGFPAEPSEKLIRIADELREEFGAPIIVTSGVRCETHNKAVGGKTGSRHKLGKAMDFRIQGFSASKTLAAVKKRSGIRYAYAIDGSHVHMDVE